MINRRMTKHFKRLCVMLITVMVMLGLTGCWDRRELDALGIVLGVGLDKAQTPGDIDMTVQAVSFNQQQSSSASSEKSKSGGSNSSDYFNATESGADVLSVLHKFTFSLDRRLYFAQNQVIIFSEDLAKEGIRNSLDFFVRSYEPRMDTYIFVVKGRAQDVLDTEPYFDKLPASEIAALIKDPIGSINKPVVTTFDLIQGFLSKTTSLVIPLLEVKEQSDRKQFELVGCAVFKGDQEVGTLDANETKGYQLVKSKITYSGQEVMVNGELAEIIITSSKGKITPVIKDDGSIMIKIEIMVKGALDSQKGITNFAEPQNAKLLQEETERTIKQIVEDALAKGRALNADIFGFGEALNRKYPKQWKTLEPQWKKILKNIEVETLVSVNIGGTGKITKPLIPAEE